MNTTRNLDNNSQESRWKSFQDGSGTPNKDLNSVEFPRSTLLPNEDVVKIQEAPILAFARVEKRNKNIEN